RHQEPRRNAEASRGLRCGRDHVPAPAEGNERIHCGSRGSRVVRADLRRQLGSGHRRNGDGQYPGLVKARPNGGLKTVRGKRRASITAAATLLVGASALLSIGPAVAGSPWGAGYFPNVPLITQDGTVVHFYDDLLKGKKVAINLIYTSCKRECPLETARLVQVQRLLGDRVGKDLFFYSISNFMGWDDRQPGRSYTEVAGLPTPDTGALVFQSRCGACHTIGKGDAVGPDLAGVTTRRERSWLVRYLRAPDQMLAENDPIATALLARYRDVPMPNLRLSDGEIAVLLTFLEGQ